MDLFFVCFVSVFLFQQLITQKTLFGFPQTCEYNNLNWIYLPISRDLVFKKFIIVFLWRYYFMLWSGARVPLEGYHLSWDSAMPWCTYAVASSHFGWSMNRIRHWSNWLITWCDPMTFFITMQQLFISMNARAKDYYFIEL